MRATFATLAVVDAARVRAGRADQAGADQADEAARHLPDGCRGRKGGPLRLAVGRDGADRHRQPGGPRYGSHHGDADGGGGQADRPSDPDALPRRPRWRVAGTGQARADQALHRPRPERRGARAGRRLPGRLRRALRQGEAHRRQARRQASDSWPRLAHRDVGRQGAYGAAPRRGQAQPRVRGLHAAQRQSHRRQRPVGGKRHHVRQVPRDRSRRSAVEQGEGSDVPEQSRRAGRSLHRLPSRHRRLGIGGARARAAAACRDRAERHAQGRDGADEQDDLLVAWS